MGVLKADTPFRKIVEIGLLCWGSLGRFVSEHGGRGEEDSELTYILPSSIGSRRERRSWSTMLSSSDWRLPGLDSYVTTLERLVREADLNEEKLLVYTDGSLISARDGRRTG